MKKCSDRMLDTECAIFSTGVIAAEIGVGKLVPTPAAVGPIRTILSAYLLTGILPDMTS